MQDQSHRFPPVTDTESDIKTTEKKVLFSLIALYIAQAIPMYLIAAALPAIFRQRGVDLVAIGSLSLLLAPWVFKFLWAPIVDRYGIQRFGQRKSWIIPLHLLVCVLILLLGMLDPLHDISLFFPLLCLLSIAASTQDIATDGYAVEHLPEKVQARGGAIQGGSVAAGVVLGGSTTLFLYDWIDWQGAITVIGLLALFLIIPIVLLPEALGKRAGVQQSKKASLGQFFRKPGALSLLIFAFLFRLSEGLVKSVEQAFLVDQSLTLSQIGMISGGGAACVGLVGSLIAVYVMGRYSLFTSLAVVGLLRTICFFLFTLAAALPFFGHWGLAAISFFMTFMRYLELSVLYATYMRWSQLSQAGTDFTFLTSITLLMYMLGGFVAGIIASALGYVTLFSLATCLSVGTLLICLWVYPAEKKSPTIS